VNTLEVNRQKPQKWLTLTNSSSRLYSIRVIIICIVATTTVSRESFFLVFILLEEYNLKKTFSENGGGCDYISHALGLIP